ncbi:MAG: glycoside hydrolase family 95 protein [Alistipes sp.]|nr:glycoside hydrolase family 95 protein [Candidatus Minthomonas equi]
MRIKIIPTVLTVMVSLSCAQKETSDPSLTYFFNAPSAQWEESFPLGNGRIGMMPDGGIRKETIVLNESSVWSGSRQNSDNPKAVESLAKIRELLFAGKNDLAQELMYDTFVCGGEGTGHGSGFKCPYGSYQLFGNLVVEQNTATEDAAAYRRELRLPEAISEESFTVGGVTYGRTYFASYSDDICLIRYTADRKGAIGLKISMNRDSDIEMRPEWQPAVSVKDGDLIYRCTMLSGLETDENPQPGGMEIGGRVKVLLPGGGELVSEDGKTLSVINADEVILLVAMCTDYYGGDVENELSGTIDKALALKYDELVKRHTESFGKMFGRVSVDFGHNPEKEAMPMDKRLQAFHSDGDDPSLAALYYQFGRYLLVSSTREGCLPPNLQGIWANTIGTPWNGDYHLNINLQMNLWPAEVGNLSELHLPLFEWMKKQVPSGQHTAQVFYGSRGWTMHTPGNVWEYSAPGEHPSWGASNTSAAWLCEHLYEHYRFTGDGEFLKEVYPIMKEAALFFVDMLVENPNTHYLVTAPTNSPENSFILPNGHRVSVCAGSTMDNQIIRELFTNVREAASILGTDAAFADTLSDRLSRLKPTTIGDDGRIMEWMEPYEEAEINHRHVSHLYGLHPANEITVDGTPELAAAARKTLEVRGDVSTGWSMAWKINFWARLRDGEHAFKLFRDLLKPIKETEFNYIDGGGTYPNLFCGHQPYQIDGNFGGCAGIAEMLVQSQGESIVLLPALPQAWKDGSFKGLCVRGGGEMDASWNDGKITSAKLTARGDGTFFVDGLMKEAVSLKKGESWSYQSVN